MEPHVLVLRVDSDNNKGIFQSTRLKCACEYEISKTLANINVSPVGRAKTRWRWKWVKCRLAVEERMCAKEIELV